MWFIVLLVVVVCAILFFLPTLTDRKKSDNQEKAIEEIKQRIDQNNQGPHI